MKKRLIAMLLVMTMVWSSVPELILSGRTSVLAETEPAGLGDRDQGLGDRENPDLTDPSALNDEESGDREQGTGTGEDPDLTDPSAQNDEESEDRDQG